MVRKKAVIEAFLTIAGLAFLLYALAAAGLYLMQRYLIYVPDPAYYTPADAGLADIAEVRLDTPDGERLIAWWARPPPASRPSCISTAMPAVFTPGPTVSVASPRRGSASSWSPIAAIP
ncbi:MAG: hypothetical protein HC850_15580, partial [Rhodomicrobium sp.]|nr:hypothetical protein [Rhodomicrobium sp.]